MIVDDEEAIRDSLMMGLEEYGWETLGAHSAATALEFEAPFDIYLIDLGLPDKSGFELTKDLRAKFGQVPIVILSGYLNNEIEQEAKTLGIREVLRKPFRFENLDRVLSSTLKVNSAKLSVF